MAKRKVVEVEVLEFASVKEAEQTKAKCEKKMEKYPLARLIAIIASVCGVLGGIGMMKGGILMLLTTPAVLGAIATYVLIGGLGAGIKAAGRIAKAGWYLIPIFPVDIFVLIFAFVIAIYALFLVPALILRSIHKEIVADMQAAEEYLQKHAAQV